MRWIARPGALQITGTLGLLSAVFLCLAIYGNMNQGNMAPEEEVSILTAGNFFHLQGSFGEMAMICGLVLGLICAYFDRLRPKNFLPGDQGSNWGMNFGGETPFAIVFWVALAITVEGYLCSNYPIGPDNAYILTLGLIPPVFGYLAHKSSQPASQSQGPKGESFPSFDDEDFDQLEPLEADQKLEDLKAAWLASEWAARTPHAVEVPFETVIAGVLIRGRIDAVYKDGDRYEVVDWKTGSKKLGKSAAIQLAVYRLAWATLKNVELEKVSAAFHYVPTSITDRPADLMGRDELVALLEQFNS
jgi:hypothetical protein